MESPNPHLVVLDFPGIKRFVFGTDRLVEIRGASALLDLLNRDIIPKILSQKYGASRSRCVFAGGGAGQFIIEDSLEDIRATFDEIEGEVYTQSSGGLRIKAGIAAINGDYRSALDRAFLDLEQNKRQVPFDRMPPLHNGFLRECDSCSGIASEITSYGNESRTLCAICQRKEQMGAKQGLSKEFSSYLSEQGGDLVEDLRPRDFQQIGDRCLTRRGYTALVYGDGNAMGRIVKEITDEGLFRRFSEVLDQAVREACYEALQSHCKCVDGKLPADILMLGGDDLIVYMSADMALPFAIAAARLFEEKTRDALCSDHAGAFFPTQLGHKGLTLSFGIAYGRSHTPISIMVDQAEELLKSAKKRGSTSADRGQYPSSCIDFHMTSHFNQAKVVDCRRDHLSLRTAKNVRIRLYDGPYTLDEAQALLDHSRNLKSSNVPASRLHRLRQAPFLGKVNGTIETLRAYDGSRDDRQKEAICRALDRFGCFTLMPWRRDDEEISTVVVDLVEIAGLTRSE